MQRSLVVNIERQYQKCYQNPQKHVPRTLLRTLKRYDFLTNFDFSEFYVKLNANISKTRMGIRHTVGMLIPSQPRKIIFHKAFIVFMAPI